MDVRFFGYFEPCVDPRSAQPRAAIARPFRARPALCPKMPGLIIA